MSCGQHIARISIGAVIAPPPGRPDHRFRDAARARLVSRLHSVRLSPELSMTWDSLADRCGAAQAGEDFKRNLQIADLDFATIHVYPSNWGVPAGTCLSWINNDWIGDRAALAAAAGKPLVLEVCCASAEGVGCWHARALHLQHLVATVLVSTTLRNLVCATLHPCCPVLSRS